VSNRSAEKSESNASTLRRPTLFVLGSVAWCPIFSCQAIHEPPKPNITEVSATSAATQAAAPKHARRAGRWLARHSASDGSRLPRNR